MFLFLLLLLAQTPAPAAPAPDFKVVFWLDGATLRHQAYDVRKGQFTPAVDDWLRRQRFRVDEAGYVTGDRFATVRDVFLAHYPGRTEHEKLDAAIAQETRRLFGGDYSRLEPPPAAPAGIRAVEPLAATRPAVVSRSSFYVPPRTTTPWLAPVGGPLPSLSPAPGPLGPRPDRSFLQPPPSVPIYLLARPR